MKNDLRYDFAALVAVLGTVGALVLTGQSAEMLGAAAIASTSLLGAWRQRRQRPDRTDDERRAEPDSR